ncbi:MAG TPA: FAD-dependent oxidoreductase, partial [Geminicoccaceae bacterium]|nr:FAD-dependent oxidoreductase [Geminicoccaceae bacterium]
NYFTLVGAGRPFSRLIYPVPEQAGLGVHVTIDLGGQVRFGPDVEWIEAIDYDVDPRRADVFYDAVRKYYPALRDGSLAPGYAGIRPKITPKGAQAADFVVQGPAEHGVEGLVHLFGIESPGITSSLALADEVGRALGMELRRAA